MDTRSAPVATERGRTSPLFWIGAVVLWLLACLRIADDDMTGAERAGYVVGSFVAPLLLALLGRLVYWLIRGRRVAFWSPWIFVIAAGIGLLALLGNLASG